MVKRKSVSLLFCHTTYDIYHCCVYSEKLLMMDRGTVRNMQFHSKNKFENLVHLVGFILRNSTTHSSPVHCYGKSEQLTVHTYQTCGDIIKTVKFCNQ